MDIDQREQETASIDVKVSGSPVDGRSEDRNEVAGFRFIEEKEGNDTDNHFIDEKGRPNTVSYRINASNGTLDVKDSYYEVTNDGFEAKNFMDTDVDGFEIKSDLVDHKVLATESEMDSEDCSTPVYKSLMTEFDEYVANEKFSSTGTSRALSYGLEVGDMVWGKVKSHPWWPGHIFNEAFASSSVRRTRRDGHVLVAFFGDSSYGWFDPAELIPFEANFAEKSRQLASRNFVKAVEEAMDETSRRKALGLVCKCRSKFNFRPTNVQGYFSVDVPDYEPGGVYSTGQIKKARDGFMADEMLSFIKQLAVAPRSSDETSLDFINNRAAVFAYRKAVFEEFDETYAEAFGMPALSPSRDTAGTTDQPVKVPTRAPLSGPLVIAEALGGNKSSSKPTKVKEHSKKDKYLFKRRDEPSMYQARLAQVGSSVPAAYIQSSSVAAAGGYVLQKRPPSIPPNSGVPTTSGQDISGKPVIVDQSPVHDAKPSLDKSGSLQDGIEKPGSRTEIAGVSDWSDMAKDAAHSKVHDDRTLGLQQGTEQPGSSLPKRLEADQGSPHVQDGSVDGVVKKKKVVKRPPSELGTDAMIGEKKKKKKKNELASERGYEQQQKRMVAGKSASMQTASGKLLQPNHASRVDPRLKKDEGSNSLSATLVGQMGMSELELPQLLSGLQALALDHFHAVDRMTSTVIKQSFLRFRSLVYQKSLVLSPPADVDPVETRPPKSSAGVDQALTENDRKAALLKPIKPAMRPDDPSKGGRKRAPSDRQEEMGAKRLKNLSKIKSLSGEKKAVMKVQEIKKGDDKETIGVAAASATPLKPAKLGLSRKNEQAPPHQLKKAAVPMMLVMKFPPKISLPSVQELKAKFARFGPLDYSSLRVFYQSSTCRVVFQHKFDAQAAYKYAVGNSSLFGNNVRYYLREVEPTPGSGPEATEAPMRSNPSDDSMLENLTVPRTFASGADRPGPYSQTAVQQQQQSLQLKSCLKKPPGEDAGPVNGNVSRGAARVKFMLGGEENNTRLPEQQPVIVGSSNNGSKENSGGGGAFADIGGPSSSTTTTSGLVVNSKNFQKSVLPPLLPLPPQFAIAQHNDAYHPPLDIPSRNPPPITEIPSLNPPPNISSALPSVDISQQMISLLNRCNDVVTNLTGLLGYVPYHPL